VQIAQDILQALEFLHGLTPQMIHRQEAMRSPCQQTLTPPSYQQGLENSERPARRRRQRQGGRLRHSARRRGAGGWHARDARTHGERRRHQGLHGAFSHHEHRRILYLLYVVRCALACRRRSTTTTARLARARTCTLLASSCWSC
jgi:hypothetical protein